MCFLDENTELFVWKLCSSSLCVCMRCYNDADNENATARCHLKEMNRKCAMKRTFFR